MAGSWEMWGDLLWYGFFFHFHGPSAFFISMVLHLPFHSEIYNHKIISAERPPRSQRPTINPALPCPNKPKPQQYHILYLKVFSMHAFHKFFHKMIDVWDWSWAPYCSSEGLSRWTFGLTMSVLGLLHSSKSSERMAFAVPSLYWTTKQMLFWAWSIKGGVG